MKEVTMVSVNPTTTTPLAKGKSPQGTALEGFSEVLNKSMEAVNSQMQEADKLVEGLVSGQHANIHETMIALEKANVSFRMMTKVQQKAIDAYREISRIQL